VDRLYAKECASRGIITLLLDCPWNRQNETTGARRVLSWEEIVDELNSF
jgi:hypothetical protein